MSEKNELKIELIERKPQHVLSIRTRTAFEKLSDLIGECYMRIMKYLEEIGEKPSDAPFTAYYNLDMNDLDVEMGFPVEKVIPEKDGMKSSEVPAGRYAVCMHKGPYASMEKTYNEMFKWIEDNKMERQGVYYEYYFNAPGEVPEEELLTRIEMPLK